MLVLSWNINGSFQPAEDSLDNVAHAIESAAPDVVTLQEVNKSQAEDLIDTLAQLGLTSACYARTDESMKIYGVLVASRHPLEVTDRSWLGDFRYPELFGDYIVRLDDQAIEVITAHMPNGSRHGWKKIEAFEALARRLRAAPDGPRILTGDFNEPREVRPSGQIVTFGQEDLDNGGVHSDGLKTSGKDELKDTHPRHRWDEGVRSVLAGASSHGLRHAWLETHGPAAVPQTWQTESAGGFFDHVFVSRHFEVESCGYLHEWREQGWSDHAAAWAELNLNCRG